MKEGRARVAVHRDPIWRDRADFIIGAEIDPGDTGTEAEQLWATTVDNRLFDLCFIPFFVYDVSHEERGC
ncbi:hypothetical protein [Microbacterium sp.]|uniref:hypothetical protein n=1 Tax=Microbacterium sp. TaxID=51671 RepID=UPI0039E28ED1